MDIHTPPYTYKISASCLFKVKAHDEDIYNNQVDTLAKPGASRSHSIDFNYSKFNFISYVPLYDSTPILTKLRLFITDIQNAKQFNTFLLLDRYAMARFYTA